MKKTVFAVTTLLVHGFAYAMPSKQDLAEKRALVSELMSPTLAKYKAKEKTASEVAAISVGFADETKDEATVFLLLRGAVSFYVKDGEFGKAADTVDALKAKVKDVPPSEIAEIISNALGRENARRAPRLLAYLQLAQAQVKAEKDSRRLAVTLKRISTEATRRRYAESLAINGKWEKALPEFAKLGGETEKIINAEISKKATDVELGDFWWEYKTFYEGSEIVFRTRAADYYRKAVSSGSLDGLKKTLVEQRLNSMLLPDVVESVSGEKSGKKAVKKGSSPLNVSVKASEDKSGLVARWTFSKDLKDVVKGYVPVKSDKADVSDGTLHLPSGTLMAFSAGVIPPPPFTLQAWATLSGKPRHEDVFLNISRSADSREDAICWACSFRGNKWVPKVRAVGQTKNIYGDETYCDGHRRVYTVSCERSGKGVLVKFYRNEELRAELTTERKLKNDLMLFLGGGVSATFDELRVYSRVLTPAEIESSVSLGPDKLPETEKEK